MSGARGLESMVRRPSEGDAEYAKYADSTHIDAHRVRRSGRVTDRVETKQTECAPSKATHMVTGRQTGQVWQILQSDVELTVSLTTNALKLVDVAGNYEKLYDTLSHNYNNCSMKDD